MFLARCNSYNILAFFSLYFDVSKNDLVNFRLFDLNKGVSLTYSYLFYEVFAQKRL